MCVVMDSHRVQSDFHCLSGSTRPRCKVLQMFSTGELADVFFFVFFSPTRSHSQRVRFSSLVSGLELQTVMLYPLLLESVLQVKVSAVKSALIRYMARPDTLSS